MARKLTGTEWQVFGARGACVPEEGIDCVLRFYMCNCDGANVDWLSFRKHTSLSVGTNGDTLVGTAVQNSAFHRSRIRNTDRSGALIMVDSPVETVLQTMRGRGGRQKKGGAHLRTCRKHGNQVCRTVAGVCN